jgi:hypothetical protein
MAALLLLGVVDKVPNQTTVAARLLSGPLMCWFTSASLSIFDLHCVQEYVSDQITPHPRSFAGTGSSVQRSQRARSLDDFNPFYQRWIEARTICGSVNLLATAIINTTSRYVQNQHLPQQ